MPQGSPISPLLSNILLDVLDKEFVRKGYRYVRYADDFSVYTKSKAEAKRIGNEIYLFLKDKLKLPINKETPEHGSEKGAHEVLESEGRATLSCLVMDLFPLTRKVIKANTNW